MPDITEQLQEIIRDNLPESTTENETVTKTETKE